MQTKRCPRCEETKPTTSFFNNRSTKDGLHSYCKKCFSTYTKDYAQRHPEMYLAAARKHHYKKLARKHGMTSEELEALYEEADGKCQICGEDETARRGKRVRRLNLDHCHRTGKVRGLLCSDCNRGIGMFRDDAARLQSAIQYLSQFR